MTPETYATLEKKTWGGFTPVYSERLEMYFDSIYHLNDDLDYMFPDVEERPLIDALMLVHCEPYTFHEVCEDDWLYDMHEDAELPESIGDALNNLNEAIRAVNQQGTFDYGYYPGNYAVEYKQGNND